MKNKIAHEHCLTLKNNLGHLHLRSEPCLLNMPRYKTTNKLLEEKYLHQALMLFLPWRKEEELMDGFESYEASFNTKKNFDKLIVPSLSEFKRKRERIEAAKEYSNVLQAAHDDRNNEDEEVMINDNVTNIGIPQPYDSANSINNLNYEQKAVFDKVLKEIKHQDNHIAKTCVCNETEPIRTFCSGVAGTIKTTMMDHYEKKQITYIIY